MKTVALVAVFAGTLLIVQGGPGDAPVPPSQVQARAALSVPPTHAAVSEALPAATLTQVVQQYCVVCHNDQLLTGNVSFQALDVDKAAEKADIAERMIRKLRAGMMPPPGIPRPGGDTLLQLVQTLESKVDAAAKASPQYGEKRFARLSEVEYETSIRDLLGIAVDAGQWLPPDVLMGSFDNVAAAQTLSTTLVDAFVRAAIEVTRLALGNAKAVSTATSYTTPTTESQHAWDHIEGTPFGTRGGMAQTHTFPADGEYIISFNTNMGNGNKTMWEDVDVSIDDENVAMVMLAENGGGIAGGGNGNGNNFNNQNTGANKTMPITVKAGQHKVSVAFVDLIDGPYEDRFSPIGLSGAAGGSGSGNVTGLTHLSNLTIEGPTKVTGVSESASRQKIFTCHPTVAAQQRTCAESILKRVATQAYRRPVTQADLTTLLSFYDDGVKEAGFETEGHV